MLKLITPKEINALPSKPADEIYFYGKHAKQFLEIRRPVSFAKKGLNATIVIIHGGCWKSYYANCKNTAALADALRDHGYLTINLEYRAIDHEGGGWPGTFNDISMGINYLQQIADVERLDSKQVIAIGHSSGGHLAMWALARHKLELNSSLFQPLAIELRGAIALGGASDLKKHFQHFNNICGEDTLINLFNGTPEQNLENYQQGTAAGLLPIAKPQVYITGEVDLAVPPSFAESFFQLAQEKGDSTFVECISVKDVGHHEYNDPRHDIFSLILKHTKGILRNNPHT
ncbi:Alpha/beta hydrolase family protein [Legionella adelaidensis]|uniref:Alpha/beta hydrolase family protein n=1 Tax=Legionella adelaidensis TaxID=45056 RepID=A0A0W0R0W1_9GAMM|nr:alpha/beta fold hydrolase [Legionella adelaidensis]KTC64736.1 Alpha/beta hydrolase family protein [Legionella adelaidensis]